MIPESLGPRFYDTVLAVVIFAVIFVALKGLDYAVFVRVARRRNRPPVPILLRDIGRWILLGAAGFLVIRACFPGVNLDVFAVSSIVVGYIVGNATQDTLGNLIAGLALNTERPFQIGDWVTIAGNTGRVVDTTWRATRLRTKGEDYVIIPNASIGRDAIINFSRPTPTHACYLTVGVDYDSPPNKVRNSVLRLLKTLPEVLKDPPPVVLLVEYGDFSVNYKIKFFIDDYAQLELIQSKVMDRLWYLFKREGIVIPYPIRDVRLRDRDIHEGRITQSELESVRKLLKGVPIFETLSGDGCEQLAAVVQTVPFAAGEYLCREGEDGDTFYVIRSGAVRICVRNSAGGEHEVARLTTGQYFGEASLLTGAKRSASVIADGDVQVICVSKHHFSSFLQADPALAAKLAALLEIRAKELQEIAVNTGSTVAPTTETKSSMLSKIGRFFGL